MLSRRRRTNRTSHCGGPRIGNAASFAFLPSGKHGEGEEAYCNPPAHGAALREEFAAIKVSEEKKSRNNNKAEITRGFQAGRP